LGVGERALIHQQAAGLAIGASWVTWGVIHRELHRLAAMTPAWSGELHLHTQVFAYSNTWPVQRAFARRHRLPGWRGV